MTWDIPILRLRTRFAELSERKVLAESCFLINSYIHSQFSILNSQLENYLLDNFLVLSFLHSLYEAMRQPAITLLCRCILFQI